MRTGYIYDESYFWHDNGSGTLYLSSGGYLEKDEFIESPATKKRVNNLLKRSRFMDELIKLVPRPATREEVESWHTPQYVDKVKQLSDTNGGDAGDHAIVGKGSYEIALLSAGGALTSVDAVMENQVDNVYALTRPPGHHAEADFGMGFCIFNNVAIAANYARKKYGLEKIMIVDWDVHHGNGTEKAFYNDPNVLFISIHQHLSFPEDTGFAEDVGSGNGQGYNVNIPLPPGTGDAGYLEVFDSIIEPIASEFQPELIIVSAGQDPSMFDPLGRMLMTAEGFRKMTNKIKRIAETQCNGKLVVCHEGGYSNGYVPFCTLRIVEALSEKQSDVKDPFASGANGYPDKVYPNQRQVINEVIEIQSKYWSSFLSEVQ
ncbi:class II histone deacetylase [Bacillus piscicola]|uniref:class II histone deacetylase n=1 Tax=Bacillus piscicola TaxID=1632684 RepID=UPI001F0969B2|nr:class II histone deacetylase [Bacillus piscicola]